ncbi:Helix-hairpin-helix motif-containing protein [Asanoa hainanensis]|uniref:Helix-hairpin-helix motif-containing protein n=1 Tax=Asanoa hainanensis TaxID=560556 RepID=A0A239NMS8_9ACTN|nr:helix-hairpin-helix domain-containing protein [Asanoa hainanensis]SNT55932.1 Helix-hairpin-helix motif-containing protein [Asanoa hainanensis]
MSTAFDPGPARKLSWRVLHSLWLVLPVAGFGCLGSSALIYLGIRMKRRALWISGIAYLVVSTALFIVIGESEQDTALSNWAVGLWLVTWLAVILHAFAINPTWLRFKATYVPWHATPLAPPPGYPAFHPPYPPAQPTYPAAQPSYPPAQPSYPAPPPAQPAPPASAEPIDVNSATAAQLVTLPHFDHARALRAVAERERRGGFADVYAFSAALGLQPHEYVRILPLVRAIPVATAPPPQPHPPGPGGHAGRILDV